MGIARGSGSLAGVLGHFLGGYLADSPKYGRKQTLLFSSGLSVLAAILLALIPNLPMLILGMIAAFSVLSIATAIYKPFAPTIIAELAPESLRGIYLAIGYQCWSFGFFLGPILGGWAMDQSPAIAHSLWIAIAVSTLFGLVMLHVLREHQVQRRKAFLPNFQKLT